MTRVILRDGKVAELRQAYNNETDRAIIRELFRKASAESLYFRFFTAVREVSDQFIEDMVGDGGPNSLLLICMAGDHALGIGSYSRLDEESAEVALLVDDRLHGKGIGTLLLEHLAQAAWRYGFKRFKAYVLNENYKMLHVFQDSGYTVKSQQESGVIHLILPLAKTERTRALQETREKLATAASLLPFFRPQTVAVVGASQDSNGLDHLLFRHVLEGGFQGTVYPVNPHVHAVAAVRAYPSLSALPEPIDLAILAVPSAQVLSVIDDCIASGVRAVIIVSAGFAEKGNNGLELQQEVVRRLRGAGCRLIGPNCLGIINTSGDIQLNASFAPQMPMAGNVGIASHSGALGIAILEYASRIGVGICNFVNMGNKADVSGNDLLQYWEDDPDIQMIVLYLESFGNPRKFSRIARRITRNKPILAVKSARTPVGVTVSEARSTALAARDTAVEALFRQTGIIRVDTLQELFDVAALLSSAPLPKGRRIAIVTNSTGGAVMTVDALLREGLEFVEPVIDLGFEALAEKYREVLPHVLRDPSVDSVIVLFIPVGLSEEKAVSQAIAEVIREVNNDPSGEGNRDIQGGVRKPVIANFLMEGDYFIRYIDAGDQRVPIYPFPEQAVRALAKMIGYAEYRRQAHGRIPDLEGVDFDRARTLARKMLKDTERELPVEHAVKILDAAGIQTGQPIQDASAVLRRVAVTVEPDPLFGPLIGLRLLDPPHSEEHVDTWFPVYPSIRITPLTDLDAREMVNAVLGMPKDSRDVEVYQSLGDLLLRLSRLVEEVPEISKVYLSQIEVCESGYRVVRFHMGVATPED